ncbi:MAG TPA: isoaspartyl peptidase/L-asparaginase [Steroidobacteraceae bacterium]|nr:isoaspartyl peptidase/L-asparaginase [Steroidobacteraceae bacterium]
MPAMHVDGARPIAIAIHGGAGVIDRAQMTPERESSYRAGLSAALDAGYAILEQGGTSLDAVTEAVRLLEDDPQFNAGRGAVLSHDGEAELDASIMDGAGPRAGAVAGIRHVKSPIGLARLVMDQSQHVMLIGEGAETFAREQGLEFVSNTYFRTPYRERELQRALEWERQQALNANAATGGHGANAGAGGDGAARAGARTAGGAESGDAVPAPYRGGTITGTVGAVAIDRAGNLAAATSTGGMTNKRYGRVGDSPIIGAGTYANNKTCAISATGSGEFFIRAVVAHDIHALVQYKQLSIAAAAREVVQEKLKRHGGEGGVIAIDRNGHIALEFNSEGMFRGARDSHGRREVAIYR